MISQSRGPLLLKLYSICLIHRDTTAEASVAFDSRKGTSLSPGCARSIFGNKESGDAVHRRSVERLTLG